MTPEKRPLAGLLVATHEHPRLYSKTSINLNAP